MVWWDLVSAASALTPSFACFLVSHSFIPSFQGCESFYASAPKGMFDFPDHLPAEAVEVSHIYNEPMFGRHIAWDDNNLKLGVDRGTEGLYEIAEQRTLGFYDAP